VRGAGEDDLPLDAPPRHGGEDLLARRDHPQGRAHRGGRARGPAPESRRRRLARGGVPRADEGGERRRHGDRAGSLRAALLLLRFGLKRRANAIVAVLFSAGKRAGAGAAPAPRTGTPGKEGRGWVFRAILFPLVLLSFGGLAFNSVSNLEHALGRATDAFLAGAALALGCLLAANAAMGLGGRNQDLAKPEWDLEWLVTLPVPLPALLVVRVLERTLLNIFGWVLVFPFLAAIAWSCGLGLAALPLGLACALPLLFLVALAATLAETWLRFSFAPARLRNFQALITILSIATFYLAIAPGMNGARDADFFFFRWARAAPAWLMELPTGLVARAFASREPADAARAALLLALEVGACAIVGFAALARLLRDGVVASGARESGRAAPGPAVLAGPARRRRLLTPVQAKELRLLGRDRNFMVQTLVMPTLILGAQAVFNPGLLRAAAANPANLGALAFSLAAYGLMFSAFHVLNSEGQSLWLAYTLPLPLETIVRQKAALWAVLATVMPALVLAAGFLARGRVGEDGLTIALVVLAGIPIYATIAASLGVFGSNPLDPEPQRRAQPGQFYQFMMLAALYTYAIYATTLWNRLALAAITALLAFALWEKARERLPYLLDPVAAPPARATLADGIIGAQAFFVIQGLIVLSYAKAKHLEPGALPGGATMLVAALAGAGSGYLLLRTTFWKSGATEVPRILGAGLARAVAWGLAAGAVAAAVVLGWLALAERAGFSADEARRALRIDVGRGWSVALAIALLPLFEEFIFRGLVHRGLRRSLGAPLAILAGAAIYAVVQPPLAALPALGVGACAALAYERSGMLLAPMVARAGCAAGVAFALARSAG
jgi:membrane protease YdiL (CAAX protease family)